MRFLAVLLLGLGTALAMPAWAGDASKQVTLYKDPQCSCCEGYADYLRKNGFEVKVVNTHDLALIKEENGVPANLQGCHTSMIDGYVVEGHVPVDVLNRLLTEKPKIKGISLPGMPEGSPGMTGRKSTSFTIYEITEGQRHVYATE
jgi:hypothetical protein